MQRLEVSGAVRLIHRPLGVKGLKCFGRICGFMTIQFDISHNSVINRMTTLVLTALSILWATLPVSCPAE